MKQADEGNFPKERNSCRVKNKIAFFTFNEFAKESFNRGEFTSSNKVTIFLCNKYRPAKTLLLLFDVD